MAPARKRAPRRSNRNLSRQIGRLRASVKGHSLTLPADPPKFTQIPWNTIILNDEPTLGKDKNQRVYSASTIFDIFKAQTGLQPSGDISFRLIRVSTWNLSGNPINLEVLDLTIGFGSADYLVQLEDTPGRNRWARIGYELPESQRLVSFNSKDTEPCFSVGCTAGDKIQVRIKVLWKSRVNTIPNRGNRVSTQVSNLEARIATLESTLSRFSIEEEASS